MEELKEYQKKLEESLNKKQLELLEKDKFID